VPVNDKRSLLEIQEEEQARQAEDDFLKWWAAEEEQVKLEAQILAVSQAEQGKCLPKTTGPRRNTSTKKTPKAVAGKEVVQSERSSSGQSSRQRQTPTLTKQS
jgi:inhibitor of Bruton tyrosine kinase